MRRLAVVFAVLALAGCGGDEVPDSAVGNFSRPSIGTPRVASNDPAIRREIRRPSRGSDGAVIGIPRLRDLGDSPPPAQVRAHRSGCSGTTLEPVHENIGAVKSATVCLVNAERKARGLQPLRANARLARAALLHARDMVARAYFSHTSASGASFVDRIARSGYMRGARAWTVGENLAWGSGPSGTPSEIVLAWMDSPGHRANILNGRFREIGSGAVLGVPAPGGMGGATYNTGFGTRLS